MKIKKSLGTDEFAHIKQVFLFTAWGWNSGQSSPTSTKDFKKFVVIRVAGDEKNEAGLSTYTYSYFIIYILSLLQCIMIITVHKIYMYK